MLEGPVELAGVKCLKHGSFPRIFFFFHCCLSFHLGLGIDILNASGCNFFFFRERKREHEGLGEGAEGQGKREKPQADSPLSVEPDVGHIS